MDGHSPSTRTRWYDGLHHVCGKFFVMISWFYTAMFEWHDAPTHIIKSIHTLEIYSYDAATILWLIVYSHHWRRRRTTPCDCGQYRRFSSHYRRSLWLSKISSNYHRSSTLWSFWKTAVDGVRGARGNYHASEFRTQGCSDFSRGSGSVKNHWRWYVPCRANSFVVLILVTMNEWCIKENVTNGSSFFPFFRPSPSLQPAVARVSFVLPKWSNFHWTLVWKQEKSERNALSLVPMGCGMSWITLP